MYITITPPRRGHRVSPKAMLVVASILAAALVACEDEVSGVNSWTCDVTLTLVPSVLGDLRSPEGSGHGSGMGVTQQEALTGALAVACAQLPLSSSEAEMCRAGEDFTVAGGGSGNVRLSSAVDRSVRCRSGSS